MHNPGLESRNSSVWLTSLHRISESVISHKKRQNMSYSGERLGDGFTFCLADVNRWVTFVPKGTQEEQQILIRAWKVTEVCTLQWSFISDLKKKKKNLHDAHHKWSTWIITGWVPTLCIMAVTDLNQSTKTSRSCFNVRNFHTSSLGTWGTWVACVSCMLWRILPFHNVDAGLTERIFQREEEEWSGRARVAPCGLQLLELLPLLPFQFLLVHDERLRPLRVSRHPDDAFTLQIHNSRRTRPLDVKSQTLVRCRTRLREGLQAPDQCGFPRCPLLGLPLWATDLSPRLRASDRGKLTPAEKNNRGPKWLERRAVGSAAV